MVFETSSAARKRVISSRPSEENSPNTMENDVSNSYAWRGLERSPLKGWEWGKACDLQPTISVRHTKDG